MSVRTYLPHRSDGMALVVRRARGWHVPIRVLQIVGGRTWSLAIVTKGEPVRDGEVVSSALVTGTEPVPPSNLKDEP